MTGQRHTHHHDQQHFEDSLHRVAEGKNFCDRYAGGDGRLARDPAGNLRSILH
jgi:hypothetical protein